MTVPVLTTFYPGTYTAPAVTTVVSTETVVYCPFANSEVAAASTSTAAPVTSIVGTSTSSILEEVTSTVVEAASSASAVVGGASSATAVVGAASSAVVSSVDSATSVPGGEWAAVTSAAAADATSVAGAFTSAYGAVTSAVVPVASSASAYVSSVLAPSAVTSSSAAASSTTTTGTLGGSGNKWAMTYTPYDSTTGDCKTADAVDSDVASIANSGFTVLRVYSTDCDTLPNVGAAAAKYGLKMIVGIFISEVGCANGSPDVDSQISALKEWARWDLVDLMAVGNEALYDGYCTPQELVDLIGHVRSELSDYTGPYTTTDIVSAWQQEDVQSVVCGAVDVVAANVHAYFSANVAPADAGDFVKGQIEIVEQACANKTGYVLECGYPTSGAANGLSIPSVLNQKIAITAIQETIGDKVVFFSMFDDEWKSPGECECEQHWGVGSLFGLI